MAYVEEALLSVAVNNAPLAALVGTRIYPQRAPEGTAHPLILYGKISGVRVSDHDGSDLAAPRFSFRVHSLTYGQAATVANKLREALDGYEGTVLGVTMSIQIANELDGGFLDEDHVYQRIVDFIVHHNE